MTAVVAEWFPAEWFIRRRTGGEGWRVGGGGGGEGRERGGGGEGPDRENCKQQGRQGARDSIKGASGAAAHFIDPTDVVEDREGTTDMADCQTESLWTFVGRTVTTLAGGSEAGTADGAGADT
jgi:hypothetical protein